MDTTLGLKTKLNSKSESKEKKRGQITDIFQISVKTGTFSIITNGIRTKLNTFKLKMGSLKLDGHVVGTLK